jgi:hypothetical protein
MRRLARRSPSGDGFLPWRPSASADAIGRQRLSTATSATSRARSKWVVDRSQDLAITVRDDGKAIARRTLPHLRSLLHHCAIQRQIGLGLSVCIICEPGVGEASPSGAERRGAAFTHAIPRSAPCQPASDERLNGGVRG